MTRRRGRTDGPHTAIREALRGTGWYVRDTSGLGDGFPDLVAARAGRLVLIEVKDGTLSPSRRQLTADEAAVYAGFAAAGVQVYVVMSVEGALAL